MLIVKSTFQPHVRREACAGLYRLCFGKTAEGKTGYPFLLPILSCLLSFLPDALKIKPQKRLDVSRTVSSDVIVCFELTCMALSW